MSRKRRIHIVNFSGGKDSTATLLLCRERGFEHEVVFADTGHEHPLTYEYVDYIRNTIGPVRVVRADFKMKMSNKREFIVKQWAKDGVAQDRIDRALELLVPTGVPMLDLCLWKGRMPSTKARFCTQELKVIPITTKVLFPALKEYDSVWSWQGVRADESPARAKLRWIDQEGDIRGVYNYRPILKWTADQVFDMHKRHGIKPNPLYKMGMGRVGCMPCVNCRKSELAEISRRFPEEIQRFKEWEALVSQVTKCGSTTWFPAVVHSQDKEGVHYTTHGISEAVSWAKTSRGGRQFDLLDEYEEIPSCSSIYGLCE